MKEKRRQREKIHRHAKGGSDKLASNSSRLCVAGKRQAAAGLSKEMTHIGFVLKQLPPKLPMISVSTDPFVAKTRVMGEAKCKKPSSVPYQLPPSVPFWQFGFCQKGKRRRR